MKARALRFSEIWKWINDDRAVNLTKIQAEAVFDYWDNLPLKEEIDFDCLLFYEWKKTDDVSEISPKSNRIISYEDIDGTSRYLYTNFKTHQFLICYK